MASRKSNPRCGISGIQASKRKAPISNALLCSWQSQPRTPKPSWALPHEREATVSPLNQQPPGPRC